MYGTKAMLAFAALACAAPADAVLNPQAGVPVTSVIVQSYDADVDAHILTCGYSVYVMPEGIRGFRQIDVSHAWGVHPNPGPHRTPECHRRLSEGTFYYIFGLGHGPFHYYGTLEEFRRAMGQHPNHQNPNHPE